MAMIDRIGHELEVGDICVMPHKQGYVDLQIGRVVGFTPQNVRLEMIIDGEGLGWSNQNENKRMIQPQGLIAITGEDALAYVLKNG